MKEKLPNSRKPFHRWFWGSFGISEGNITGRGKKKKKKQNTHLTTTASREVAQMLMSPTSEQGLDREARLHNQCLQ